MPELPEVEARVKYLKATSLHKTIVKTRVTDDRIVKGISVEAFRKKLRGRSLESAARRGKFILLRLDRSGTLIMHLGMTGDVKYYKKETPPYACVIFSFSNGFNMAYTSRRKLQGVWLKKNPDDLPAIRRMGPEPLSPHFSLHDFTGRLKERRANLKALLMDQTFVAGLGNIYADEILFQCGISPARPASGLKAGEVERVYHEMRRILSEFCNVNAKWESLQDGYLAPHRSLGVPCPRCGEELRRLKISGRSSYFCPRCQK